MSSLERDHDQLMCTRVSEERKLVTDRGLKFMLVVMLMNSKPGFTY
jgi:hypothetical protein